MAIVRAANGSSKEVPGSGSAIEARAAAKTPAKAAKHAAKKHAAKKLPAKKHAAKKEAAKKSAKKSAKHAERPADRERAALHSLRAKDAIVGDEAELGMAFHHMRRAGAVISLLEPDSGGDLRALLEHGIDLYRSAAGKKRTQGRVRCAAGLLRAAEHLGMAGLYIARSEHRVEVGGAPFRTDVQHHLELLGPRLDGLAPMPKENAQRLEGMARELLRRAADAREDGHLEYELTMAADGICTALEAGL